MIQCLREIASRPSLVRNSIRTDKKVVTGDDKNCWWMRIADEKYGVLQDQWTLLLGCVRVGHIYEHGKPKIFTRFPPMRPKGVFRALISRETYQGGSDADDAAHTLEQNLGPLNLTPHLYTYGIAQTRFLWISMLQSPASAKPEPWWKRSNFPSVRSTDVERGPVDIFAWLCQGRPYILT